MILKWFYRNTDTAELRQLLEMAIKSGRRATHDLEHAASTITMLEHENRLPNSLKTGAMFTQRAEMWHNVFYPLKGLKNYKTDLAGQIYDRDVEIRRLRKLCVDNNIDPEDPEGIPF